MDRYDHREKIGNQGDLIKHFVLLQVAKHIKQKTGKPFTYVESHAGRSGYKLDIDNPEKGWRAGVGYFLEHYESLLGSCFRMEKRLISSIKDFDREPLERINMMVNLTARNNLKRLASCYGVTQRTMLEQVIREATRRLLETMGGIQQNDFYDMKLVLRSNDPKIRSD